MTPRAFARFAELRGAFAARVAAWLEAAPWLASLQEELRLQLGYEDYRIETPVVANAALDEVTAASEPAYILVADNPGKKEQLERNRRYLVGQSGKLAEGWFRRELGLDFRRDVIIVNKTPLHTPKTAELRRLLAIAGARSPSLRAELSALLEESQRWMAGMAWELQTALGLPLWISGYGELGAKGLFSAYAAELGRLHAAAPAGRRGEVLLFRHFSMNQFAIEMRQKRVPGRPLGEELSRIGEENRRRVLGW